MDTLHVELVQLIISHLDDLEYVMLKNVSWFFYNLVPDVSIYSQLDIYAAEIGSIPILMWLKECNYEFSGTAAATQGKYQHVLEWLVNNDYVIDLECYEYAAARGDIAQFIWLQQHCKFDDITLQEHELLCCAVLRGHTEFVKWFIGVFGNRIIPHESVIDAAIGGGYLELAKLLLLYGFPLSERVCTDAALSPVGSEELITTIGWLIENGASVVFSAAVYRVDISVLKWLVQEECSVGYDSLEAAAKRGDVKIFEWVRKLVPDYPMDSTDVCNNAVLGNNPQLLKLLVSYGYCCGQDTINNLIASDNFELLRWCHDNGHMKGYMTSLRHCPSVEILQLLWDGGYIDASTRISSCYPAIMGHINTLEWLHSKGFKFNNEIYQHTAECGMLEVLKYFLKISDGMPFNRGVHEAALVGGYMRTVQWLESVGCPRSK